MQAGKGLSHPRLQKGFDDVSQLAGRAYNLLRS